MSEATPARDTAAHADPSAAEPTDGGPSTAEPTDGDRATAESAPGDGSQAAATVALSGRLHPSVIALWSLRVGAPLVALLFAGTLPGLVAAGIVGVSVVGAAVRWARFEWRVEHDDLVIEHGLLQRTRRVIPRERIQAVQTVRKLRHRMFGVVGLRIEAIGGSDTEGQLDALTPRTAAHVQRVLMRTGTADDAGDADGHADADATAPVLFHCTPRMLLVAGLTGGRVGVAAAIVAFAQEFAGERFARAVVSAPDRLGFSVVVTLVLVGLVIAFVLSVIATAITYWGLTITSDDDRIVLRRGLLDERRDTVPVRRIQSITVEENVIRRIFGLAAVKMTVAGRAGDSDGVTGTLTPIATRGEAFALTSAVLGVEVAPPTALRPMPTRARTRRLVRAGAVVAVITAAAVLAAGGPLGLAGVVSVLVAVPAAVAAYRALGWLRDDGTVLARSGVFVQRTSVTPLGAPQSVRLSTTPFQRRRRLATVRLEIARSRGARDPRLIDLDADDAGRLQHDLAAVLRPT